MKQTITQKTEQNLREAISGECQAAVLYEFFASKAKSDGFEEISEIFRETAQNEKAHAEIYFKLLQCISTTNENLKHSVKAENHEHTVMYPEFARQARDEGLTEIANTLEAVAKIEAQHEKRFQKYLCRLENNAVFSKGVSIEWKCRNCGHIHQGPEAPGICPVCSHPASYFEASKDER